MPPRLTGDRRHNHRTLKGILRDHKSKSSRRSGKLMGVAKRHDAMTATLSNIKNVVAAFTTKLDEVQQQSFTNRALTPQAMRRLQASNDAVTKALGDLTAQIRDFKKIAINEEESNRRIADIARRYHKENEALVLETARWMSSVGAEITNAESMVRYNAPLQTGTEPLDESGKVVTTLMQLHAPDRTFRDATDTIFTTSRGSGARRANLPGTPAARARAAQGIASVKPQTETTSAKTKETIEGAEKTSLLAGK